MADESLRDLVQAKYGTMAAWGREIGESAYKARQWAKGRDATITPDEHARIAASLGLTEADYYAHYRQTGYQPGQHLFSLTSRQLVQLLTIASEIGGLDATNTHFERMATQIIAQRTGTLRSNGETWLATPEMRDFLKWWAFSLDFQAPKEGE